MPSQSEILQEFLVSLKFFVDESSIKKMLSAMKLTETSAFRVGKSVLGVAAAAQTAAIAVAYEFERLYYASKRMNESAPVLQAYKFGMQQIGISAETFEGAVSSMAAMFRTNPGMSMAFKALTGKEPSGTVKSMIELVKTLQKMPYFVAAKWAKTYGISEDMFNMLMQPGAIDKMQAEAERRAEINERLGLNVEAMAKASAEYMTTVRELTSNFGALTGLLGQHLLPAFRGLNTLIEDVIQKLTGAKDKPQPPQQGRGGQGELVPEDIEKPTFWQSLMSGFGAETRWRSGITKDARPGSGTSKVRPIRPAGSGARSDIIPDDLSQFGAPRPGEPDIQLGSITEANRRAGLMTKAERQALLKWGTDIPSVVSELKAAGAPQADIDAAVKALSKGGNGAPNVTLHATVTNHINTNDDPQSVARAAGRSTEAALSSAIRDLQPILNTGGRP